MGELSPPRPGAMTAAMRAVRATVPVETWARVAIVRDGTIVEQRWIAPGDALTWGRTERADVVVASAPHDVAPLITWDEDAHTIVVDAAITGRVSSRGQVLELRGDARRVSLEQGARARLVLGGASELLVEMTPRPPRPRRAPLPRSAIGALGLDERFTAIAVASLVLHATVVTVLAERDWPAPSGTIESRIASVVFVEEPMPPVPDEIVARTTDGPPSDDVGEGDADAPSIPTPRAPGTPRPSAPSRESLDAMRAEIATRVDAMLGAIGEGGAMGNLLRDGAPLASEADVMGLVRGDEHAALAPRAGDVPAMRDGAGIEALARGCEGCGDIAVHRVGPVREGEGPPREERPVQVSAQPIEDDGPRPGFDPRALARAMRGRMGAVRACYERALRDEPTLAGRIDVDVQVERVGTLSDVHVREGSIGDAAFHGCVERAVRAVRLPSGPEDGPASVSFPFVFAPQG